MDSPRPSQPRPCAPSHQRGRGIGQLLVLGLIAAFAAACSSTATTSGTATTTSTTVTSTPNGTRPAIEGVVAVDVASAKHVQGEVDYPQTPPLGGDHAPRWQNCGAYSEPISAEAGVHALEHGAVWITYQPTLDPVEIAALEGLVDQSDYILVTPWPDDLPAPIVASAWGAQLPLDSADDPRLMEFLTAYVQALTAPEPGAPCSGGISASR